LDLTIEKEIVVEWPRDLLLPLIDGEVKKLMRYLTRDSSWKDCFGIQVSAEGIVGKLNKSRVWRRIVSDSTGITDDYVAHLVVEVVTLWWGMPVVNKGVQMVLVERGSLETVPDPLV